jgi:hypothetical protein
MAREHWFQLKGFPEINTYSMNVDGLFGYVAHYAGIREQILEEPCCIYHIEHDKGSGWTPEGEAVLRRRMDDSGIPWVDATIVTTWASYMDWLGAPLLFNLRDWGFGDVVLPEVSLVEEMLR